MFEPAVIYSGYAPPLSCLCLGFIVKKHAFDFGTRIGYANKTLNLTGWPVESIFLS